MIVGGGSVVLGLVTIILVWLTCRQAKRTADAAVHQARAANQGIAIAADTAQRQLRDYFWREQRPLDVSLTSAITGDGRKQNFLGSILRLWALIQMNLFPFTNTKLRT